MANPFVGRPGGHNAGAMDRGFSFLNAAGSLTLQGVCTRAVPFVSSLMAKPTIFTISAVWDETASVWSGHCDDIPAAADAPSLDELLTKISAMALDMLPDNHPDIDPATLYLQMTALREAEPTSV